MTRSSQTAEQPRSSAGTPGLQRRPRHGMTMIEVLIVLAVIGILLSIGFVTYRRLNQSVTVESAASELSQAIMDARSQALRSGNDFRVIVNDNTSYSVEESTSSGWATRRSIDLSSGITFDAPDAGSSVEFDTRGFANFSPTDLVFRITDGRQSRALVAAMSGNTRVQ